MRSDLYCKSVVGAVGVMFLLFKIKKILTTWVSQIHKHKHTQTMYVRLDQGDQSASFNAL